MKQNTRIREAAKAAGVRMWQVAEKLGIQDTAFSRKLRHELPEKETEKVLGIIAQLAEEVRINEA